MHSSTSTVSSQIQKDCLKKEFQLITNSFLKLSEYFTQFGMLLNPGKKLEEVKNLIKEKDQEIPINKEYEQNILKNIRNNFIPNLEKLKLIEPPITTDKIKKRIRLKVPRGRNISLSKVYPVKTHKDEKIKMAYRILLKFMQTTICLGPYPNYQFALNVKRNVQKELLNFNPKSPNVEKYVKKCLNEIKKVMDEAYPPLKMMRNAKASI